MTKNHLLMPVAEINGGGSMRAIATLLPVILAGAVVLGVLLAKSDLLNPITNQALVHTMAWEYAEQQAELALERQRQQLELEAYARRLQRTQAIWETSLYMFSAVAAACLIILTIVTSYRIMAGMPNRANPSHPVRLSPHKLRPLPLRHSIPLTLNMRSDGHVNNELSQTLTTSRKQI